MFWLLAALQATLLKSQWLHTAVVTDFAHESTVWSGCIGMCCLLPGVSGAPELGWGATWDGLLLAGDWSCLQSSASSVDRGPGPPHVGSFQGKQSKRQKVETAVSEGLAELIPWPQSLPSSRGGTWNPASCWAEGPTWALTHHSDLYSRWKNWIRNKTWRKLIAVSSLRTLPSTG